MKLKEVSNMLKTLYNGFIMIVQASDIVWEGYLNESKIFEYLLESKVIEIYNIENGLGIIIE